MPETEERMVQIAPNARRSVTGPGQWHRRCDSVPALWGTHSAGVSGMWLTVQSVQTPFVWNAFEFVRARLRGGDARSNEGCLDTL